MINQDGSSTIMDTNGDGQESKLECIKRCKAAGEIKGAYAGIRRLEANKFKCICLDRSMTGVVGILSDFNAVNEVKTHPNGVNPFYIYKR